MAEANREYKDRLFKFIFGNPENREWTLSLYNGVNGTHYTNAADIQFNTLEDVLYMGMVNDVSFIISSEMSLWEHQATYSPNLPLRFFIYAASLYEKYIAAGGHNLYGSRLQKLPKPSCICFYNGTAAQPEKRVLKLSDAFGGEADIEVKVTMLNINSGKNQNLMDVCTPLKEYAWVVEQVRLNRAEELNLEHAVSKAIADMPEDFVLKKFLTIHEAEVKGMLLQEYTQERILEMARAESMDIGLEQGLEQGRIEGREEGRDEERARVAADMLKDGVLPIAAIAKYSKMSEGDVRNLAREIGVPAM